MACFALMLSLFEGEKRSLQVHTSFPGRHVEVGLAEMITQRVDDHERHLFISSGRKYGRTS
jgi:hypothetical protein